MAGSFVIVTWVFASLVLVAPSMLPSTTLMGPTPADSATPAAPEPPRDLSAVGRPGRIELNWDAATEPLTEIRVYRGTATCEDAAKIATVLLFEPSDQYIDTNVQALVVYCYFVRVSMLGGEESPNSNEALASPLLPPDLSVGRLEVASFAITFVRPFIPFFIESPAMPRAFIVDVANVAQVGTEGEVVTTVEVCTISPFGSPCSRIMQVNLSGVSPSQTMTIHGDWDQMGYVGDVDICARIDYAYPEVSKANNLACVRTAAVVGGLGMTLYPVVLPPL